MSNFSCARNYIFCQILEKVEGNIVGGKWKIKLQFQINKVKIFDLNLVICGIITILRTSGVTLPVVLPENA